MLVFLPLGFVLDFPSSVPRYIERGRRQLHVAKQVGREAVSRPGDAGRHLDRLQAQTRQTLRALGVAPAGDNGATNGDGRRPGSATPASGGRGAPGPAMTASDGASGVTGTLEGHEAAAPPGPTVDVATLAIPDYDSLSASQVVPRLDSLALDELELVRQYELGQRGRKTILSKIAQLQAS